MEQIWSATRDTKEAACLSTFGVPVRIDKAVDGKSGKEYFTLFLGAAPEESVLGTSQLRKLYKGRDLSRKHPKHPLLWCLVALKNRERLLDLANKGRFARPVRLRGGQHLLKDCDQGLPGVGGKPALMKIIELEMATAMITLGLPLLMIEGPRRQRVFYFQNHTDERNGRREILNAHALVCDFRSGKLAVDQPEHSLLYCMLALYNRAALIKAMNERVQMVIVQKPRSQKSALVRADASDKAWGRVQKHFGM